MSPGAESICDFTTFIEFQQPSLPDQKLESSACVNNLFYLFSSSIPASASASDFIPVPAVGAKLLASSSVVDKQ